MNLKQGNLDDIMSTTDESFHMWLFHVLKSNLSIRWIFQGHSKHENVNKNEKIRQKVAKLSISQEEFAGKLLKSFSKKLDEIQAADRDLTMVRNT